MCSFYGWDSNPKAGLRELDSILHMIGNHVKPFVILGDFNIEADILRTHVEGMSVKPLVIEGGGNMLHQHCKHA